MKLFIKTTLVSLGVAAMLPMAALAADSFKSNLKNQSDSKTGYYLVQEKIWSNGCVVTPSVGKHTIKPGESAMLEVKSNCSWGGVRYKVFKVENDKMVGMLAHSYRDGSFSMDISEDCSGSTCEFHDLNPSQHR